VGTPPTARPWDTGAVHRGRPAYTSRKTITVTVTSPDRSVRVLLVDGQRLVREGLRLLLAAAGLTVVADTGRAAAAAELCARTLPEVVLLDPLLPDLVGVPALRAIRRRAPRVPVVALAVRPDRRLARDLLAAGAHAFLLKDIDRACLVAALVAAVQAEAGEQSGWPLPAGREPVLAGPEPAADRSGLTPREREVLALVARGRTNRVIAAELAISAGTVRSYLSGVLAKLGAANRTQAVMIGIQRGWVPLPPDLAGPDRGAPSLPAQAPPVQSQPVQSQPVQSQPVPYPGP
jgi:DNA-binding NarL/FixJ family response regulator